VVKISASAMAESRSTGIFLFKCLRILKANSDAFGHDVQLNMRADLSLNQCRVATKRAGK
jgi:hypothetical protein